MRKIKIYGLYAILSMLTLSSCKDDLLDADSQPTLTQDQLDDLNIKFPEKTYLIYSGIESGNNLFMHDFGTLGNYHDDFGVVSYQLGLNFMTDQITMTSQHWFVHYLNYTARLETSIRTRAMWSFYYKVIYNMNSGLTLMPEDNNVLADEIKHVKARYLAMRADAYFNLIRVYANGDIGVPLFTEKEKINDRVPTSQIRSLIESDLLEAHTLISGYSRPTKEYINKNVIAGMLARFYLERKDWAKASQYAQEALAGYSATANLFDGFNKIDNPEWIWGADVNAETSSYYASFFSQMGNLNAGYAGLLQVYKTIDKRLFDKIPATDVRKDWFLDTGNPFGLPKYSNVKFIDDTDFEGDYVYMRAAEMFLIDAEAKANLNVAQGQQALNAFVQTRNPAFVAPANQNDLLEEIYYQRSLELWGEGGFAFYDMKRLNRGMNRAYPGSNHTINQFSYPAGSPKFIFQIPLIEIDNNPAGIQQNPL